MLRFAAEHPFVVAAQVAQLLGVTETTAQARLVRLTNAEHLRCGPGLASRPAAYQIRPAGLRAIGSDLRAPGPVNQATYRHDLGVGWLMLDALRGRFGPLREILGERRMRSYDGRRADGAARFGSPFVGAGRAGLPRLNYPDLVLVDAAGRRIAFELELSDKGRLRRQAILEAYAADRRIDAVVYLVDQDTLRPTIAHEAQHVGAQDLVGVWTVTFPGVDEPRHAAGRDRSAFRPDPGRAGGGSRYPATIADGRTP